MAVNDEDNGKKSSVHPSMRKLADLIKDVLNTGIPGYPDMPVLQWVERFATTKDGRQLIGHGVIYQWIRQRRIPSMDMLVLFGILLKESGADVGVFDPLLAAADGLYYQWLEDLQDMVTHEDLGDYSEIGTPEEAPLAPPVESAVQAYSSLRYADRKAVMVDLLKAIGRDLEIAQMKTEFEVVQKIVQEAVVRQGNHYSRLADTVGVPKEWIKAIVDGKFEESQQMVDTGMIFLLADKVPDLDGEYGKAEFFACLLPKSGVKELKAEVRRKAKDGQKIKA